MKKLLVLMLVLGLTSVAYSAMTLQIAVYNVADGTWNLDPVDSQIFMAPSDTLILGIWASGFVANDFDSTLWELICDPAYGTITGGVAMKPPAPSLTSVDGQDALGDGFAGDGYSTGPYGGIAGGPGEVAPGGIYIGDLLFHCEAVGDAVIKLYISPDAAEITLVDTLTIHQVPEPASMLLLGLGGLLLRRRK